jgi:hypothetical protein
MLFEKKQVILRREHSKSDRRSLVARLCPNGDVVFDGQDLGEGVKAFFGSREYEWSWTVKMTDVPKLRSALGVRRGLLEAIERRFRAEAAGTVEPFLKEHSIPYLTWSRVGD